MPILLSDAMLPAFSDLLDWSRFSARLPAAQLHRLKPFARKLDHARLLEGVRRARDALFYRLGAYEGNDLLPLLLHSIARKVTQPTAHRTPRRAARPAAPYAPLRCKRRPAARTAAVTPLHCAPGRGARRGAAPPRGAAVQHRRGGARL